MKALPILAITNALALGLVILLYMEQGDLKSQLKASRTTSRGAPAIDYEELAAQVAALHKRDPSEHWAPPSEVGESAEIADGDGPPALPSDAPAQDSSDGGTDQPGLLQGESMEGFRRNVRKAQELNRAEDRIRREITNIDRLIEGNKIGPLDPTQKRAVARTLISYRDRVPSIWRKLRDNPEIRDMNREDRARLVRVEYQTLRDEATKELEDLVPAADAKSIMDASLRGFGGDHRGRGFPMGGGGPGPPRRTAGTGR